MEFLARKKKNPPAVIIVALIDVLIVVLIFLLVTTTFKQQPALKLTLPESSQGQQEGSSELSPVTISIDSQGQLYLGAKDNPINSQTLQEQLSQLVRANPQLRVAVAMDKDTPVGAFIQVMDATKAAGVKSSLAIMTQSAKSK